MKNIIKKIFSRITGAAIGLLTGFVTGFIPGIYLFFNHNEGDSMVGGLVYVISLPFFLLWHMICGAFKGASQGFAVGLRYPKIIDDSFQTAESTDKLMQALKHLKTNTISAQLLTEKELSDFKCLLQHQHFSKDKQTLLEKNFKNYQFYIKNTRCILTAKPLKDIEHPLQICLDDKNYVCDKFAFRKLVINCQQKKIPVNLMQFDHPLEQDVITRKKVHPFNIKSLPKKIYNFIFFTKNLFFSMNLIRQTLCIPSHAWLNAASSEKIKGQIETTKSHKNHSYNARDIRKPTQASCTRRIRN